MADSRESKILETVRSKGTSVAAREFSLRKAELLIIARKELQRIDKEIQGFEECIEILEKIQELNERGKIWPSFCQILESLTNGPEKASRKTGYGRAPTILMLFPTRELAKQVYTDFEYYGKSVGLSDCCLYGGGGASIGPQITQLNRGVDIVVGAVGRVKDHIEKGKLDLKSLKFRIEKPHPNLVELLVQSNLYDMVCTVILKVYKGSVLKRNRKELMELWMMCTCSSCLISEGSSCLSGGSSSLVSSSRSMVSSSRSCELRLSSRLRVYIFIMLKGRCAAEYHFVVD
ncbi:DNA/RNA helicase, DEAD/DEAH box type, N-terminal [Artemisia annua]|uniref:RNA helicase n=1 Tax=Artemisia annua TaxID=35608 RepID=A0A2U1MSF6_ARTAN|nr:DNA/RNA helicase, DEAD/DEAH box type, N-terminal [Artemisia annua]